MATVTEHKENLTRELTTLDSVSQLKFASWCCFALTGTKSVFDFLSRYSVLSADDIHARIVKGLDRVWGGDKSGSDFSDLRLREWDIDDISMGDDANAQGASDLLGALSFLHKWIRAHSVIDLVSCAEQVINRIDYLEGFGLLPGNVKSPVEMEIHVQTKFIEDLRGGLVGDDEVFKYHELLMTIGNP
ncbi:hypothetical protein [Burkholderia cepacia]|uniref:hypothetical protein n=1 Tax=Burkholderia cepacia TaxID=292 RepID=UPI0012D99B6B|nr:hypothetical protein [Burkholderia cepacia]